MGAFKVTIYVLLLNMRSSTDSESTSLVMQHALSSKSNAHDQRIIRRFWSHMSYVQCSVIINSHKPLWMLYVHVLGNSINLQAIGCGRIVLTMNLLHGKTEKCTLHDVLIWHKIFSVWSWFPRKAKPLTTFSEISCEIRDSKSKLIATRHRDRSLYYLEHGGPIDN